MMRKLEHFHDLSIFPCPDDDVKSKTGRELTRHGRRRNGNFFVGRLEMEAEEWKAWKESGPAPPIKKKAGAGGETRAAGYAVSGRVGRFQTPSAEKN